MANENLNKLEELLAGSEELQTRLQELNAAYDGDKGNEEALFEATLGKLAEEQALPVTYEEAKGYFEAHELSDEQLAAVAGGSTGQCAWAIPGSPEYE